MFARLASAHLGYMCLLVPSGAGRWRHHVCDCCDTKLTLEQCDSQSRNAMMCAVGEAVCRASKFEVVRKSQNSSQEERAEMQANGGAVAQNHNFICNYTKETNELCAFATAQSHSLRSPSPFCAQSFTISSAISHISNFLKAYNVCRNAGRKYASSFNCTPDGDEYQTGHGG